MYVTYTYIYMYIICTYVCTLMNMYTYINTMYIYVLTGSQPD